MCANKFWLLECFSNEMWVTDLPTTDYEPLEESRGVWGVAKKVGVSSLYCGYA